jgi:hypothetical protein
MKASDVLWKRYQSRLDEEISEKGRKTERTADQLHEDYAHLEHRVEKLTLICRAMWELLCKSNKWDDDTLFDLVKDIDGRDGEVDGKIGSTVIKCPRCGHPANRRHPICVYCGFRDFKADPFTKV